QKALKSLKLKKVPLTNLASRLANERKAKEERLKRETFSLRNTASILGDISVKTFDRNLSIN
ncbi:MAG: hypothetical protein ACK55Z_34635, partial [bacterium]